MKILMRSNYEKVFRVEIIAAAQLPSDTERAIISLCNRAYKEDLEPLFKTFKNTTHVIGYLDNFVISHAM